MFEGLPMVEIPSASPISRQNFRERLHAYSDVLSEENLLPFDGSFSISAGSVQTVLPLPYHKRSGGRFARIQCFALIDADEHYYTRREGIDSFLLLYTYEGAGELVYDGRTYSIRAGEGFLIDCRAPHQYRTVGKRWKHSDVHFFGGASEALYQEYQNGRDVKFALSVEPYQLRLERLLRQYFSPSTHWEFFVAEALTVLIGRILLEDEARADRIPPVYQELLQFISANYSKPLSLDLLARQANVIKYHLSREFHKYTGFSPGDYITELRVNHAMLLLANTDIPACRIGEMVGIPNEANFIRHFKKKTGVSPGQYRAESR